MYRNANLMNTMVPPRIFSHRRPNEVVKQHRCRAALLWISIIAGVLVCEHKNLERFVGQVIRELVLTPGTTAAVD